MPTHALMLTVILLLSTSCASAPAPAGTDRPRHGATRAQAAVQGFQVWDRTIAAWVSPEDFMGRYLAARGPATYPPADAFPPYATTQEHDTMRLLTPDGGCEMYFFHTRWRRLADVEAWGRHLREWGACATVFTRPPRFQPE